MFFRRFVNVLRGFKVRKLLIGFGVLAVLLVAAVLVGPSLIDWNKYKGEIEQQVADLTGRQLTIAGEISIAVLPAPAVIATDVTFSNDPRSETPNMVELGSLEVRVALGPLFGGEVQVSKIVLVEPVVQLEVFADGSNNWTLDLASSSGNEVADESPPTDVETATESSALDGITLDNFAIEGGLVTFRDAATGALHAIEDINATLVAATLQGPFEARGELVATGIPLDFEIGIDGIFQGRTVPISATVRTAGETSVGVSGNIINLFEDPRFNGNLQIKSTSPVDAAAAVGAVLPSAADQTLSIASQVEGSQSAVILNDLVVQFGEIEARGEVAADLSDIPRVDASLNVDHLDVDALLASLNGVPVAEAGSPDSTTAATTAAPEEDMTPDTTTASFEIPNTIAAALNLSVDSLAYRQQKAGPIRLSAEMVNGEVTLSQLTGALPGSTDFAVFGFLTAQNGEPNFEGEVEATIADTRGLARWLDVDLSQVPGDRLRRIEASATLRGNAENLQAAGVRVGFDRTTVTGGITLARRDRLSFGAAINIDRIDLDPYLAALPAAAAGGKQPGSPETSTGQESATQDEAAPDHPLAALAALTEFDANIKATAGEVIYQGTPIRDITVDGTVFQGGLTLRELSVKEAAGARASVSGTINDLGGTPNLQDVVIDLAAGSVGEISDMAGIDLQVPAGAIGAVALKAAASGDVLNPAVKGQARAAGGQVDFDGDVSVLEARPLYAGALKITHPDLAGLLRAFEVGYEPAGPIGGVDLSANASITADVVTLQGMSGVLNQTSLRGDTTVRLAGVRPNIQSTLALGRFNADPFLPVAANDASSAASAGGSGSTAASNDNQPGYAGGKAPWPRDPLDLSGMSAVDATIDLTAEALSYGAIALNNAVIKLQLANGQLTLEQLNGSAFGGTLGVTGFVDGQSTPAANGNIAFRNGDIARLLTAVIGEPSAVGSLLFESNFDTRGVSVHDMVTALNGQGAFQMKGVDVSGSTQGSAMSGILGLLRGFGQLGSGLSGNSVEGLADVNGRFAITNGVADLSQFTIASALGAGVAGGKVDLANWNLDVAGDVDITGNILTALLGAKINTPGKLPFSVSGALDAPNISMDTSGLGIGGNGGSALPVPIIGNLLQGVLGGGSSNQQQPAQQSPSTTGGSEPQPQPQPQQQTIQPQDLLKEIFKF